MYEIAFKAHSGWRYVVLFFAFMITIYALWGLTRKRPADNTAMGMLRMFGIFIDIQFVLGLVTVFSRPFFSQLIGHIVLMVSAIAVAHLGTARLKKTAPEGRSYGLVLASALVPLLLMIGGILAIQRPIL